MKALIYQIGRLDVQAFSKIKFLVGKDTFETSLSSFAIRDFLKIKGYAPEAILIYPVSLPFNPSLIDNEKFRSNCNDECYKLLMDAFNMPYKYLKHPQMFFKAHPHSCEAMDFKVIHSLYEFGYYEPQETFEILRDIMEHTEKKLTEKYDSSPNLNKNDYLKVFLTCGFYCGISNVLKANKVSEIDLNGIEIETLRECFKKINNLFGLTLNDIILGNEVDKIKKDIKSNTEWDLLINLLYSGDKRGTTPQKRNFFAHAGFEGNITRCRRQKGRVYLRYTKKHTEVIRQWLKESV